ncbi:MAG TPA: glutamine-hydrolyzing carbamoyl-phosphate synthase small subunit [Chloroflexota bacterium]|nr:glutamine-hydrolyzing carbamoyl-phosphate synthase small subunit [Chloroflexota bacterium]
MSDPLQGTLLLEDGTIIHGTGTGAPGITSGELVFTTAMTGYQEALTDPSYRGQILLFTYPLIGNYGTTPVRDQSGTIQARGAVFSTLSPAGPGQASLTGYLAEGGVPAAAGIDTRALARHIRTQGAMPAALAVYPTGAQPPLAHLQAELASCAYDAADLVSEVTLTQPEFAGEGPTVAVLDCGNKRDVVEMLLARGVRVALLPATTRAEDVLRLDPIAVIISNGPGNPANAPVIDTARALYGRVPLFGICLGHQVIALAAGARTYKLTFGHRGANHPVIDCASRQAFITTQNHGYAVDAASLPDDLLVSYRHLNDDTVEGLSHRTLPIRSVQFHPEGAPGPRDAGIILDQWLDLARSPELTGVR